jgi:hypothetical protein
MDGKVISHGPWRPPRQASGPFADTVLDGKVGSVFRVCGRHRSRFRMKVIEVPKGLLVIQAAKTEIGTHYAFGVVNGPEDPGADAFDCSGLTLWAWASVGINLPHNADDQKNAGNVRDFSNVGEAEKGDLVFMWFPNSRGIVRPHASHVGLFYAHSRFERGVGTIPNRMLDTRNPVNEPVAIRDMELGSVVGFGRPT